MELVNESPFAAERTVLPDRTGRDVLVVVVKATYDVRGRGLSIAREPAPIQLADTFHGEPGASSPRLESDLAPAKRGTDVVVIGHACAPGGRARQAEIVLTAGPIGRALKVFGERRYGTAMGGHRPSSPEPFERIPLIYERAFGGRDESAPDPQHHEREARNPVGVGFVARRSNLRLEDVVLPNIEDPAALLETPRDRPEPAGLGFIGRSWEPRARWGGTYDDAWSSRRAPLQPDDFDDRYHQGAHPRLVSNAPFAGGEPFAITGMTPGGPLHFQVPVQRPKVHVTVRAEREALRLSLDTIVVFADEDRVSLVYRGGRPLRGDDLLRVRRVQVEA